MSASSFVDQWGSIWGSFANPVKGRLREDDARRPLGAARTELDAGRRQRAHTPDDRRDHGIFTEVTGDVGPSGPPCRTNVTNGAPVRTGSSASSSAIR
jgi:hypothetical protein